MQLFSNSVQFVDCTIGTIETDAISKSGINAILFTGNRIKYIQSNAIRPADTVNTTVSDNTIGHAAPLWLNLSGWQRVRIERNRFGIYSRAQLAAQPVNPIECRFANNLITEPGGEDSLYFEYGQCAVRNVTFAKRCECDALWPRGLFRNGPKDGQLADINCAVDDTVAECYNTTHMVWTEFRAAVCTRSTRFAECEQRELASKRTRMDISGFAEVASGGGGGLFGGVDLQQVVIVVGSTALLVVLLIAVGMVCNRIKRGDAGGNGRRRTADGDDGQGNVTCSEQILTRCDATALAAREANAFRSVDRNATQMPLMLMLAMKPSKSFSADDRVIIRQTLHEMRGRYEGHLYDQVYNNTVKVLNGGLEEADKVRAIGEIVEALRECQQKRGGDFVAFTDILYRQLVADADGMAVVGGGSTDDPVYAELTDGVVDEAAAVTAAAAAAALSGDHIYAEPQHLQLPLLTSEYAWPLDRDAPAYSEYAEPHRGTRTHSHQ